MKRIVLLLATLVPATASADKIYNDSAMKVAHDCDKDGSAIFNGSAASGSVTGKCEKITVNGSTASLTIASVATLTMTGSMNEVTVDSVGKITITGTKNTVNWKKALTGAKPKITQTGVGNKVNKVKEEEKKEEKK
jgi:hypothetical protein